MTRFATGFWLVALVCAGCARPAPPAAQPASPPKATPAAETTAVAEVPLLPRDAIFGNPDRANPQISPDGKQLTFLASDEGVLNVWLAPIDHPDQAKPLTHDRGRGIHEYFWAYTGKHVLYLQDTNGDENDKIYAVDVSNGKERVLTPFDEILGPDHKPQKGPDGKPLKPKALILGVSPKVPGEILIGLNKRDPVYHDVYRVDIQSGALREVFRNQGEFDGFVVDHELRPRIGSKPTPDGGRDLLAIGAGKERKLVARVGPSDQATTDVLGFDASEREIYMRDSRGRDTGAALAVDLATGKSRVLAEDPRADASGAMIHPTRYTVQAVSFERERVKWKVLDASIQPDVDAIQALGDADWEVLDRSQDDKKWIVRLDVDDGPQRFYAYDRATKKASFLFVNRTKLEGVRLSKRHPATISSRDGLEMVSYYTLPPGADAGSPGKPSKPLPTVLWVHGGPWYRDTWGYEPVHQWLANRGYAVLSVNYRGSTGFGKSFLNAANREWAGKMHDDLIDAVDWAVKQGIADPKNVCIAGGSYGGYATLVGLTFTPEEFACGVDIVGPSNLLTFIDSIPSYWKPALDDIVLRVGDYRTDEGKAFLTSRSPLSRVDKIERPLLIGQGANDPRVKQAESDQIVNAMLGKKIPVTYLLYPDEGHGFQKPANRISFFAVMEAFLSKHLGGRYEPIGQAFEGSSVEVLEGGSLVPGLADVKSARPKKD